MAALPVGLGAWAKYNGAHHRSAAEPGREGYLLKKGALMTAPKVSAKVGSESVAYCVFYELNDLKHLSSASNIFYISCLVNVLIFVYQNKIT
jgi:hypothetical protein